MKNVSLKVLMPVFAFFLASAGAISTTSSSGSTETAAVQGWKRISAFNCQQVKQCNNISEALCKDSDGSQMYGKLSQSSDCTQLLTHQP